MENRGKKKQDFGVKNLGGNLLIYFYSLTKKFNKLKLLQPFTDKPLYVILKII